MAVLFISHNLGIIAQTANRVAVMYAGLMVEQAPCRELYKAPRHPYTRGLLAAVPRLDFHQAPGTRLKAIPGQVPGSGEVPQECLFKPRCPEARPRCAEPPPLVEVAPGHLVRCWLYI